MNCSRCNAEAVVKRGSAAYCAKCALARDWEDVIAIVQEERVDIKPVDVVELDSAKEAPQEAAADAGDGAKQRAAVAAEGNGRAAGSHLPADPFA